MTDHLRNADATARVIDYERELREVQYRLRRETRTTNALLFVLGAFVFAAALLGLLHESEHSSAARNASERVDYYRSRSEQDRAARDQAWEALDTCVGAMLEKGDDLPLPTLLDQKR